MNRGYIERLRPFLNKIRPLSVIPTNAKPLIESKSKFKAIIFDIYGTLIISASGDIIQDSYDANMFYRALTGAGFQIKVPERELLRIHKIFEKEVKTQIEKKRSQGIPFPELDIVGVWRKTLKEAENFGIVAITDYADFNMFTFIFELSSNKVWPMPGMTKIIETLRAKKIPLGIVSNAQFYTPIMMNFFFYNELSTNEFIDGFEKDLQVYSYKLGRGKPDVYLYHQLVKPLKKRDIIPEEVLFVGNDMLKDMLSASKAGFKTCFFAGDKRAYRLRKDHKEASDFKPDYIITELNQLLEVVL